MSIYCPKCGHEMFYHIDHDCLICVVCGHEEFIDEIL